MKLSDIKIIETPSMPKDTIIFADKSNRVRLENIAFPKSSFDVETGDLKLDKNGDIVIARAVEEARSDAIDSMQAAMLASMYAPLEPAGPPLDTSKITFKGLKEQLRSIQGIVNSDKADKDLEFINPEGITPITSVDWGSETEFLKGLKQIPD